MVTATSRGGLLFCAMMLTALTASSAQAQRRLHDGGEVRLGGVAAGSFVGPHHPAPAEFEPVYGGTSEPLLAPRCYILRRKIWLDDYAYAFRRERVCG